jgi:RNA recognition motif-containing protein
MPSLKFDTDRRFCYVQFSSSSAAHHATELNGMRYDEKHKLTVKISNPANKAPRSGPRYEGRELYIVNLDWSADEKEVRELFSQYGDVENVMIGRKDDGTSKGFSHVAFTTKEAAEKALVMDNEMFKSRRVRVSIATTDGKRAHHATNTTINRVAGMGAQGETNGTTDLEVPVGERADRTIALMNIPDTVNETRVRALVEPFGRLVKISLRPDHQGAVVEYVDVHDAGKALLELEGKEITPGRPLHLGPVQEMKAQRAEIKNDRFTPAKREDKTKKTTLQPVAPVRRPQQPGARKAGGGLGQKRHTPAHAPKPVPSKDQMDTTADGDSKPKKSNDDFRAMFQKRSE